MVQLVTRILDKVFTVLNLKVHTSSFTLQMLVCGINAMFSISPIILYIVYSNNIHILFWMGDVATTANIVTPISLCFLNLGVNVVTSLKLETKRAQIVCFWLFVLLGAANITAGMNVITTANRVSGELIHQCGSTTLTARIEAEWQRLSQFYSACQVSAGKMIYIQECPNFAQAFPNRVYVNYIEDVEIDYSCVGFCQFWAQPLFNLDADRGLRCATALGEQMDTVGRWVGIPTLFIGFTVASWGVLLYLYDHL